jgi:hypothetical protein
VTVTVTLESVTETGIEIETETLEMVPEIEKEDGMVRPGRDSRRRLQRAGTERVEAVEIAGQEVEEMIATKREVSLFLLFSSGSLENYPPLHLLMVCALHVQAFFFASNGAIACRTRVQNRGFDECV